MVVLFEREFYVQRTINQFEGITEVSDEWEVFGMAGYQVRR